MQFFKATLVVAVWAACARAQSHYNNPTTTPVPILKQINRQNDDGSYSFGYEAADGSFKIETKYPSGDVAGKYGYIDETGKLREVTYGASSKRGFEPQGTGIMVPPPTLNDPSNALTDGQEDDGQYREDPRIYEDPKYNSRDQARPASAPFRFQRPQPAQAEPQYQREVFQTQTPAPAPRYQQQQYQQQQYQQQQYQQPLYTSGPTYTQQTNLFDQSPQRFSQEYRPQSQIYQQQPQFSYQAYTPQPYNQYQNSQPQNYQSPNYQNQNYNPYLGHPAQNFDPSTGSYSISYTGK